MIVSINKGEAKSGKFQGGGLGAPGEAQNAFRDVRRKAISDPAR